MSFAKFDIEAQREVGSGDKDNQISDNWNHLSLELSDFANNLQKFEKLVLQLGSKRDNKNLRTNISTIFESLQKLSDSINDKLNNLILHSENDPPNIRFTKEKLKKEFNNLNSTYQVIKNDYLGKLQNIIINNEFNNNNNNDNNNLIIQEEEEAAAHDKRETDPLLNGGTGQRQLYTQQPAQATINQTDLEFHSYLVQQRSQDLSQLNTGVQELNSIFKDLNSLIQQQGNNIDRIEDNLTTYADNHRSANQELVKADKYQRKKGKWCLLILAVLVLFLIVIVLIIS
ncbi:hypothetical protein PACTADRAFT_47652 [Pachysolen tannophilus NRRL Y-2460]|uniref:t-SNARE coiled-coil homology domain-containing protein n=1 Tax=Pachysolen tannophilus NRRL Y-2460 TaxID=669874 RepID=A0A1E4U1D4_PACTA|nr:hypothetical protein PACTADRAFT_47652 [Pachysolen tannophilus NRRL Y-2460]